MSGLGGTSSEQLQHMLPQWVEHIRYVLSRSIHEMGQTLILLNAAELYALPVLPAAIPFAGLIQT
jgi:hypothetical protein